MALTKVANTGLSGIVTIAQGGTGASSFMSPTGTIKPFVFYDGSNLATDTTVIDAGYDTANNTIWARNIATYGNVAIGGNVSVMSGMTERANVTASALTANITLPFGTVGTGSVLYFTQNSSANATINFTGLSGMGVGNVASFAVMVTNNTSPKYIANVQVDGDGTTANITTKWSGGAPTSGTANIDTYAFNVIKTATTPTYTVLASVSNYK